MTVSGLIGAGALFVLLQADWSRLPAAGLLKDAGYRVVVCAAPFQPPTHGGAGSADRQGRN